MKTKRRNSATSDSHFKNTHASELYSRRNACSCSGSSNLSDGNLDPSADAVNHRESISIKTLNSRAGSRRTRQVMNLTTDYLGLKLRNPLIVGASPTEMEAKARNLGVWYPSAWDDMRIPPRDVARALADPSGFLWKPGHERVWRGSDSWPTSE